MKVTHLYRYISVRQPSADNSSSLSSKLISSNAPTYDFYLRELLRSELTYLLTCGEGRVFTVQPRPISIKCLGHSAPPICWYCYHCPHGLTWNDRSQHGNAHGRGSCLEDQPRYCILHKCVAHSDISTPIIPRKPSHLCDHTPQTSGLNAAA